MTLQNTNTVPRRVVITGARGYIGSALTQRLARQGYALRLVSRSANTPRLDAVSNEGVEYLAADLHNEGTWKELMAGADAVVHLSSRTDLRAAEADPAGDDEINVEPLRALVRAAAAGDANRLSVIFSSTVTIVGERHENPVDEKTPDCPCSVYDRHKLAAENILREATARNLFRACSLRLSNVYGYGTAPINPNRGILNAMLRRAVEGKPLMLFGDGSYIRDFTHLDDVVEAFCGAIESDRVCDGRAYVIATGRGHTLAEAFRLVAQEARRRTGRAAEIDQVPEPPDLHPIERRNFVGNSQSFQELTGWRARIDLESGIRDYFDRAEVRCAPEIG